MTYREKSELPETLRITLPDAAQTLYMNAYNEALANLDPSMGGGLAPESAAHAIAWQAVEAEYEQPKGGGSWRPKYGDEQAAESDGGLLQKIRQMF